MRREGEGECHNPPEMFGRAAHDHCTGRVVCFVFAIAVLNLFSFEKLYEIVFFITLSRPTFGFMGNVVFMRARRLSCVGLQVASA